MIEIFETRTLYLIRNELSIKKRMYRDLNYRFPMNTVYRDMYEMIKEVRKKFKKREYDNMKAIVESKLEDIETRMGDLNTMVNRHVSSKAFRDLTNIP